MLRYATLVFTLHSSCQVGRGKCCKPTHVEAARWCETWWLVLTGCHLIHPASLSMYWDFWIFHPKSQTWATPCKHKSTTSWRTSAGKGLRQETLCQSTPFWTAAGFAKQFTLCWDLASLSSRSRWLPIFHQNSSQHDPTSFSQPASAASCSWILANKWYEHFWSFLPTDPTVSSHCMELDCGKCSSQNSDLRTLAALQCRDSTNGETALCRSWTPCLTQHPLSNYTPVPHFGRKNVWHDFRRSCVRLVARIGPWSIWGTKKCNIKRCN